MGSRITLVCVRNTQFLRIDIYKTYQEAKPEPVYYILWYTGYATLHFVYQQMYSPAQRSQEPRSEEMFRQDEFSRGRIF